MSTLKQKTLKGIIWSSVQRFGTMIITFSSNIILARLLTPDDFGCIAMLMIFISLSNALVDGGFGSALIQKTNPSVKDYSTVFYWNIFLSIILYGILFFAAPLISTFYHIPILTRVLRVEGVVLFFNALCVIQQTQLKKLLEFKKLSIVYILSALISLFIAIIFACFGFGVWSIVAQQVSISFLNAVFFWTISGWRPSFVFSLESFRSLFKFGSFVLLSNLFNALSNEIQGLLVGKRFNASMLGLYNQAYRLEGSGASAISGIIDQVTYPVLSELKDNKSTFISTLKLFIQIPAYICSFVMMLLIVTAKPLIIILYSSKWIECVPFFQILCTAGLAVCLQGSANNSVAAVGRSKELFKWTVIKRTITIVFCIAGIYLAGMSGLLWSCVAGAWVVYFINAFLVQKYVGYGFVKQILDIVPSLLLSIVVGIAAIMLGNVLNCGLIGNVVIQVFFCFISYFILSWIFKLDSFLYISKIVSEMFYKSQKS